jgi:cytochrome c-type biogenesis protein CcmF
LSQAGEVLLALAALASFVALSASLVGRIGRRPLAERIGLWSLYAQLVLVVGAFLLLMAAFLSRDFGNLYVYEHSSRALSGWYTVSALWAGNAGSLLLWFLMLAAFGAAAARTAWRREGPAASGGRMVPYVVAILSSMGLFFSLLLLFGPSCNPFAANTVSAPTDGLGLNPMLQNPGMVIHPLTLYAGYVATAVPFALLLAGLSNKTAFAAWVGALRRWTLAAWLFLTIGNVVGAWWAYVTLGWGGYWAWDPVENASLIPWLTATALLHATVMAQRKGTQRVWMALLTAVTFLLTVFGTFLTRSGVAASVHAFEEPAMIPWFVTFMVIMLIVAVAVIVRGIPSLRQGSILAPTLSEPSAFVLTNVVLSVITFVILWGVVFPPIYQAIGGGKVVLAANFFNVVTAPLGLVLLVLMSYCPFLRTARASWRRATIEAGITSGAGIVALVLLLAFGVRKGYPTAAFALAAMTITTIVIMYVQGYRAQRRQRRGNPVADFGRLVWGNRRRYGGFVVHLGLAVLIIGLAGSWSYKQSTEGDLAAGSSLSLHNVQVVYEDFQVSSGPDRSENRAVLNLLIDGWDVGELRPSLDYYPASDQTWTRVARHSSLGGDVYVTILGVGDQGETITLRLELHPLINWLWVGGAIMAFGGLIALWPGRDSRRKSPAGQGAQTAEV